MRQGKRWLAQAGISSAAVELHEVTDTSKLDFPDGAFDSVLANAVLEHIPWYVRQDHIRELWRVVALGGVLVINETPNSFYPRDVHTTQGLWLNQWLSEQAAYRRAVRAGRYHKRLEEWRGSGWQGLSWYELVRNIRGWKLEPERSRFRHRLLTAVGLPASLVDPDPTWVLKRVA